MGALLTTGENIDSCNYVGCTRCKFVASCMQTFCWKAFFPRMMPLHIAQYLLICGKLGITFRVSRGQQHHINVGPNQKCVEGHKT